MVACFRQGHVVLPCTEQLRADDLRLRLEVARPALVVCDERNADVLPRRAGTAGRVGAVGPMAGPARAAAARRAGARGPVPDHVHERHRGRAEGRPARPALPRRPAPAGRALARRRARATSSGAPRPAAGASRRATSSSRRGCAAPPPCCTTRASTRPSGSSSSSASGSTVLCMAPTEYRVIAKRARPRARRAARPRRGRRGAQPRGPARLARGDRAVDPRRLRADGDRPAHGHAAGRAARPGSMGRPLPGRASSGSTTASSSPTRPPIPTFFRGYLGEEPPSRAVAHRRPRPPGRRRLPVLRGPHGRRDHLRRLPHRPVRGRVGARRAPGGGRGRRRRRARRGARRGRARRGRPARRPRAERRAGPRAAGPRQGARPRPTSTRASSTSPRNCRRPRPARSAAAALRAGGACPAGGWGAAVTPRALADLTSWAASRNDHDGGEQRACRATPTSSTSNQRPSRRRPPERRRGAGSRARRKRAGRRSRAQDDADDAVPSARARLGEHVVQPEVSTAAGRGDAPAARAARRSSSEQHASSPAGALVRRPRGRAPAGWTPVRASGCSRRRRSVSSRDRAADARRDDRDDEVQAAELAAPIVDRRGRARPRQGRRPRRLRAGRRARAAARRPLHPSASRKRQPDSAALVGLAQDEGRGRSRASRRCTRRPCRRARGPPRGGGRRRGQRGGAWAARAGTGGAARGQCCGPGV